MATDAGTFTLAEEEVRATVAPADAPVSATEQLAVPGEITFAGLHVTEDSTAAGKAGPALIELPAAVVGMLPPALVALTASATDNGTAPEAAAVNCTDTLATTPLAIVVVFMPVSTHIVEPEPGLHWIDLPAATAADPAATLTEATDAG